MNELTIDISPVRLEDHLAELLERTAQIETTLNEIHAALRSRPAPLPSNSVEKITPVDRHVSYQQMIARLREMARNNIPSGAKVLVVSKGDNALLQLNECRAKHFPQDSNGRYAGFHPRDSTACIQHLEEMRNRGYEYLLFPQTAFWWLDHYREFHKYLTDHTQLLARRDDACAIFQLEDNDGTPLRIFRTEEHQDAVRQLHDLIIRLLPVGADVLVVGKGEKDLTLINGLKCSCFPQDPTGTYLGYYPMNSEAAIALLEENRRDSAEFLIFPKDTFWWLDYYEGFASYLNEKCRSVTVQKQVCIIFDIRAS